MTPIKSNFPLADIIDTEAFRRLGESLAADPVAQPRRIRLSAIILEGQDGIRRTELVTTGAVDRIDSPAIQLPLADVRQQLTELVLAAPVIPARANQHLAVHPDSPAQDDRGRGLGERAAAARRHRFPSRLSAAEKGTPDTGSHPGGPASRATVVRRLSSSKGLAK